MFERSLAFNLPETDSRPAPLRGPAPCPALGGPHFNERQHHAAEALHRLTKCILSFPKSVIDNRETNFLTLFSIFSATAMFFLKDCLIIFEKFNSLKMHIKNVNKCEHTNIYYV